MFRHTPVQHVKFMNLSNQTMGDQEMLNDSIASQKLVESTYNTFLNECVNTTLRADFISILKEEHDIQSDLFKEMQKRGWYQVQQADQAQVTQAKQKFSSMMQ